MGFLGPRPWRGGSCCWGVRCWVVASGEVVAASVCCCCWSWPKTLGVKVLLGGFFLGPWHPAAELLLGCSGGGESGEVAASAAAALGWFSFLGPGALGPTNQPRWLGPVGRFLSRSSRAEKERVSARSLGAWGPGRGAADGAAGPAPRLPGRPENQGGRPAGPGRRPNRPLRPPPTQPSPARLTWGLTGAARPRLAGERAGGGAGQQREDHNHRQAQGAAPSRPAPTAPEFRARSGPLTAAAPPRIAAHAAPAEPELGGGADGGVQRGQLQQGEPELHGV